MFLNQKGLKMSPTISLNSVEQRSAPRRRSRSKALGKKVQSLQNCVNTLNLQLTELPTLITTSLSQTQVILSDLRKDIQSLEKRIDAIEEKQKKIEEKTNVIATLTLNQLASDGLINLVSKEEKEEAS